MPTFLADLYRELKPGHFDFSADLELFCNPRGNLTVSKATEI